MVLFSMLKLIHGGIVHHNLEDINLLMQNKYYVIPSVNVDGIAYIERNYAKSGRIIPIRKNRHATVKCMSKSKKAKPRYQGVDLKRNYGFKWGTASMTKDPCGQSFMGESPFSEPETQAIRDFLTNHKKEIKFVFNFHASGRMWFTPYVGEFPNNLQTK